MLGIISYGVFLAVLAGLMRLASLNGRRARSDAAAAMLAARVN
jgi:hypothetical protein